MAQAAQRAGFQTIVSNDLGMTAFQHALRDFRAQADGAQVAMVYYAGHGIEGSGANWLIPTDATLASERDLSFEAINLDQVVDVLAGAQFRIVILDACRNNPFGRQWSSTSRAVTRGLAPVQLDDVMVIYAAAPGQIASDGTGANSPFATAFANHLADSGVPLQLLGGVVGDDVAQATKGEQRPYVSASITGTPFFLVARSATVPASPLASSSVDDAAIEAAAWQGALQANSIAAYEEYLRQYPQGRYAALASASVSRLRTTAASTTAPVLGRTLDGMVGTWTLQSGDCPPYYKIESVQGGEIRFRYSTLPYAVRWRFTQTADNEFRVSRFFTSTWRVEGNTLTVTNSSSPTPCQFTRAPE